ncbi:MAG: gliding motility-associated C-terminal domain-containing protein [Bacteroidia bacterium]
MSYTFPEVPVFSDPPTLNSTECLVPGYVSLSAPTQVSLLTYGRMAYTEPTTVYTDAFEGDTISVAIAGGAYCDTTLFYFVDTLPAFNQDTIFNTKYVCTGTAVDSITFGQGFIAVIWEDGSTGTTYVFENPQQDQQISLNAVPPLGCPITYIFTIEIVDPSQSLSNQYFFCPAIDDITLRAPEGYSAYFWPDVQSSSIEISYPNPLANDSVSVYCTGQSSSGGCPLELIYILREYSLVQDDTVSSTVKICPYQETVELEAQSGFSAVYWPLTGENSLQITHMIQHDDLQVELNMTDENDCEYVKLFNLEFFPPPADTTIDIGQYCITSNQVDLFAPEVYYNYQWSVNGGLQNDTNSIFDYKNPTPHDEIQVAFIDSFNCLRIYNTDLDINMLPGTLVENPIPNVFSPIPADGLNDVLLFPFHDFEFYRLEILNRWGETIYTVEGNIGPIQWDGKNRSGKIVPGTYFYKISLSACNAPELDFHQGFVHLVGGNE